MYEYDRGGNRVSEKLYAYTLGAVGGDPQEEIVSYYGPRLDSVEGLFRGWYDVLRTYDGKGIQYDRSGNPVSYDGKTFTWNGKQLTKITAADGSCTEFAYDANGIRTQKRQFAPDGTLEYFVDYVWQDGLLTHQNMTYFLRVTVNGETRVAEVPFSAKILYDENDMPVGSMVSDEGAVGYVRNLQGDIVALVSPEGEVLVEYSYDPWGNVTVSHGGEAVEGLEAAIVAVFCPFAYRGYNYDFTTGLYYLQSRYYNPEWGRFLNVDDTNILLATQGESLGANLFAYCGNNPVNMVDYTGYWAEDVHSGFYILNILAPDIIINESTKEKEQYGTYYWALQSGFSKHNAKIIADSCIAIDSLYPAWVITTYNQSWHFNTNHGTSREDSRIVLFTLLFLIADAYIRKAETFFDKEYKLLAAFYVGEGLKYLGYALHPIQDYYAHTNAVSENKTIFGISYWSHLGTQKVDVAKLHKDVVLGPVKEVTMATLTYFVRTYHVVLENVQGVAL